MGFTVVELEVKRQSYSAHDLREPEYLELMGTAAGGAALLSGETPVEFLERFNV
jgi:hypothetical protein